MKKVLITGGAGYIGSHTARWFLDNNYDVVVADNLQTGHIEAVSPEARFYCGDIRDFGFLDNLFQREKPLEAVVHFAADSLVGESMADPLKYYANNLCGTRVLLEAMVKNTINRIVFSSTAATYGEPQHIPILETDPAVPTNPYGETKLAIEKMMKWASVAHGIKYVSLRYFNACGAHAEGQIGEAHAPETHLIPLVLQVAAGQRPDIKIFGSDYPTPDGTCVRDYIHVMDLAQAHMLAVDYLACGNNNEIFNLGSGTGFSVREVIACARKVTGCRILSVDMARRDGDPAILVASAGQAEKLLGWKPRYAKLETIIGTAWNWHKSHPQGYARM
jgi:UDP-glucose 4-epimerase